MSNTSDYDEFVKRIKDLEEREKLIYNAIINAYGELPSTEMYLAMLVKTNAKLSLLIIQLEKLALLLERNIGDRVKIPTIMELRNQATADENADEYNANDLLSLSDKFFEGDSCYWEFDYWEFEEFDD